MVRVTVDNQVVEVTPGSNLLAAVRKAGRDVPALCYHPACPPNTACMLCMVRVRGSGRLVPACATVAEDGLEIECDTGELRDLRQTLLELLLSDHGCAAEATPAQPAAGYPLCDCPGHDTCRLRRYAGQFDADPRHYAGAQRDAPARIQDHPQIEFHAERCILCGVCLQIAAQFDEPVGLTLVGRGFETRIDTPPGHGLSDALTTSALRAAGACPTAALTRRP